MGINDFEFLHELTTKGSLVLTQAKSFSEAIYESNIPYRPGIYLVYSLSKEGSDDYLLYYGKAGVTGHSGMASLNFHQLPRRLVATIKIPENHPDFGRKTFSTRAEIWPWYVKNVYKYGIRIYWFIAEWPSQNPNDYEKRIKAHLKEKYPQWEKSI
ncbi:MAG: hypothetical protein EOM23_02075 [Candidatus Moranbacteria bacterium]|nr:hypothetical protein [Candidatus Moranbacteria bacterium]